MIGSFYKGIKSSTLSWKMLLLLLISNIIFALPVALPLFVLVMQTAHNTLAAEKMMSNKLDIEWFADVLNLQMPGVSFDATGIQTGALLAVMGLTYLVFTTLLNGGIIAVFALENGRFTLQSFFSGCGKYFRRFLRLMMISLFFYGVAYLVYFFLNGAVERFGSMAVSYDSYVYKKWSVILLLLVVFGLINMVFDYARILTVINDDKQMISRVAGSIRFVGRNVFKTSGLYLLITMTGLLIFSGIVWLRSGVVQSSWPAVILAILLGQLAVASRMWARMVAFASQLDLYLVSIEAESHITEASSEI